MIDKSMYYRVQNNIISYSQYFILQKIIFNVSLCFWLAMQQCILLNKTQVKDAVISPTNFPTHSKNTAEIYLWKVFFI